MGSVKGLPRNAAASRIAGTVTALNPKGGDRWRITQTRSRGSVCVPVSLGVGWTSLLSGSSKELYVLMVPGIAVISLLRKGELKLRKAKSLASDGMIISAAV